VVGAGFLAIAALMVLVNEYVASPGDLPGMLAGKVVGAVAKEPEVESDEE
jgi:F0F1-type ATP synthase membrane subunit c/vacuolar-type H+-ATPase subunit K